MSPRQHEYYPVSFLESSLLINNYEVRSRCDIKGSMIVDWSYIFSFFTDKDDLTFIQFEPLILKNIKQNIYKNILDCVDFIISKNLTYHSNATSWSAIFFNKQLIKRLKKLGWYVIEIHQDNLYFVFFAEPVYSGKETIWRQKYL